MTTLENGLHMKTSFTSQDCRNKEIDQSETMQIRVKETGKKERKNRSGERSVNSLIDKSKVIDDYAKDGGPEEVCLSCRFYHESLRSLIVKEVQ